MARKATKEDLEVKRRYIGAYFDDLRDRIDFLLELPKTDHEQEAMLLCYCYIDGLAAHLYWPDTAGHRNFVRAIRDFGPHEFLARIHPKCPLAKPAGQEPTFFRRVQLQRMP